MPAKPTDQRPVQAGDRLVVHAHRQGQPARDAEILEVLGSARDHYRVQWQDDGHESIVYPGVDVTVERLSHRK